jgi:hypothetical protein
MAIHLLTAKECQNATCEGVAIRKLHDGEGLYLWLFPNGKKYWRTSGLTRFLPREVGD